MLATIGSGTGLYYVPGPFAANILSLCIIKKMEGDPGRYFRNPFADNKDAKLKIEVSKLKAKTARRLVIVHIPHITMTHT